MLILIILSLIMSLGLISGFLLFKKVTIPTPHQQTAKRAKISVIIPARNEELNLPKLLASLASQTMKPDEVIVIDDHSEDGTKEVASRFGVKVISAPQLPQGWTGKAWAVWNGYEQSSGEILIFLDADVRLAERAIESMVAEQRKQGGVLSVVPFHITERFYERFAMVLNLLGVFAFTSPFERRNERKGLYGACIVASRDDYEKIGGHQRIRTEMLDDLTLGASFQDAGIKVTNYIGAGLVSFRMYPGGFRDELEGFAKGAVLSTSALHPLTLLFVISWIIGLIVSQGWFLAFGQIELIPLCIGYILYVLQITFINRFVGRFGFIHSVLPILSVVFFLIVVVYSLYQSIIRKKVIWKGRTIDVGRDSSA